VKVNFRRQNQIDKIRHLLETGNMVEVGKSLLNLVYLASKVECSRFLKLSSVWNCRRIDKSNTVGGTQFGGTQFDGTQFGGTQFDGTQFGGT
jgi:hypothetical protein